jgi:hypothetical protein
MEILLMETQSVAVRWPPNMRRSVLSEYLKQQHGIVVATSTLAKWFCQKSDGPPAHIFNGIPLYPRAAADEWAARKLGPLRHSTSDQQAT